MKKLILLFITILLVGCGSENDNVTKFSIYTDSSEYSVVEDMKKDIRIASNLENIRYEILDKSQTSNFELFKNKGILIFRAPNSSVSSKTEKISLVGIDAKGNRSEPLTLTFKTVSRNIQPSVKILKTGADDGGFGEDRNFSLNANSDVVDSFGNTWAEASDNKLDEAKSYLSATIKCEILGTGQGENFRLPTMDEALNLIDYSKTSGSSMLEDAFLNQTLAFTWVEAKNDKNIVVSFNNALVANIDSFNVGQNYTSRCIDAPKSINKHIISTDRDSGYTFDFSTGLKWSPIVEKRPIASDNNETASEYCVEKHSGRVPNINEIRSIVEGNSISPLIVGLVTPATIIVSSTPFNDINTSVKKSNYVMLLRENGTIGFGTEDNDRLLGITCVSNF